MVDSRTLLLLIVFFDSLCTGLVVPVLSPHIFSLCGNHIVLGLLTSGNFACQILSEVVISKIETFYYGRQKCSFCLCLLISFVSYSILVFTTSYWVILLCRFICSLTNATVVFAKTLTFLTEESGSTNVAMRNLIDIAAVTGIVVGPVSAGYFFNYMEKFVFNALAASVLSFINIGLLLYVEVDYRKEESEYVDCLASFKKDAVEKLKSLKNINYRLHWDKILLKVLYNGSLDVYFSKFPFLIAAHYQIGPIVLGFTTAYQNMLIFSSNFLTPLAKNHFPNYVSKKFFHHNLITCAITIMGLYYAPCYESFLIILVPMIMTRVIIEAYWGEFLGIEADKHLCNANRAITVILGISVPTLFGIACNYAGTRAFVVLTILPITVCLYIARDCILNSRTAPLEEDKED